MAKAPPQSMQAMNAQNNNNNGNRAQNMMYQAPKGLPPSKPMSSSSSQSGAQPAMSNNSRPMSPHRGMNGNMPGNNPNVQQRHNSNHHMNMQRNPQQQQQPNSTQMQRNQSNQFNPSMPRNPSGSVQNTNSMNNTQHRNNHAHTQHNHHNPTHQSQSVFNPNVNNIESQTPPTTNTSLYANNSSNNNNNFPYNSNTNARQSNANNPYNANRKPSTKKPLPSAPPNKKPLPNPNVNGGNNNNKAFKPPPARTMNFQPNLASIGGLQAATNIQARTKESVYMDMTIGELERVQAQSSKMHMNIPTANLDKSKTVRQIIEEQKQNQRSNQQANAILAALGNNNEPAAANPWGGGSSAWNDALGPNANADDNHKQNQNQMNQSNNNRTNRNQPPPQNQMKQNYANKGHQSPPPPQQQQQQQPQQPQPAPSSNNQRNAPFQQFPNGRAQRAMSNESLNQPNRPNYNQARPFNQQPNFNRNANQNQNQNQNRFTPNNNNNNHQNGQPFIPPSPKHPKQAQAASNRNNNNSHSHSQFNKGQPQSQQQQPAQAEANTPCFLESSSTQSVSGNAGIPASGSGVDASSQCGTKDGRSGPAAPRDRAAKTESVGQPTARQGAQAPNFKNKTYNKREARQRPSGSTAAQQQQQQPGVHVAEMDGSQYDSDESVFVTQEEIARRHSWGSSSLEPSANQQPFGKPVYMKEMEAAKNSAEHEQKQTNVAFDDASEAHKFRADAEKSEAELVKSIELTEKAFYKKYWIEDGKLGKGSFAKVLKVTRKKDQQIFALKMIKKAGKSQEDLAALQREIAILAKLEHPNVVALQDWCETKKRIYMVVQFCDGGDVFERILKQKTFSEKEAAHVVRKVAEGLQHVHENNIIHRDLKPDNLMYLTKDPDSNIMIIDFGLAGDASANGGTLTTPCGTAHYVAPEVLSAKAYDAKADMWSLGVIIYMLLCGFPPFFDAQGNQKRLYKLIKLGKYRFPSPYWDYVSEQAKDLIKNLLVLDPVKRFSAKQVLKHKWIDKSAEVEDIDLGKMYMEQMEHFSSSRHFIDQGMKLGPGGAALPMANNKKPVPHNQANMHANNVNAAPQNQNIQYFAHQQHAPKWDDDDI